MHNHRSLKVWNDSIELSIKIHLATKKFPKEEIYGAISQMNRCAVSIPSNIAEGAGRNSEKEFDHFLSIALGSSFELETQVIISRKINYLNEASFIEICESITAVQKMIYGLKMNIQGAGKKSIRESSAKP